MQKLKNNTLQKFLENVITELKRHNDGRQLYDIDIEEFDIPFIISSLWQSFNNRENDYKEFISDLKNYSEYNIIIEDSKDDYNGIVDIFINLVKYEVLDDAEDFSSDNYDCPGYGYRFEFSYDERNWGYCDCTPDMPDYREDKHCCGHGCDASFCQFKLHKVLHVTKDTWHGDEHDYWDFEDAFYASDKELTDKKAEDDRLREIEMLKKEIKDAINKLIELESGNT